ncbi:MAG: BamA/TamA family outer membrane protein [Prevotella sp.]|nr:BamA/TamA family outer membrane protein [Prevotella sp.]
MSRVFRNVVCMAVLMLALASCSTTRFVPEGHTLLNAVHVDVAGEYKDINTAALRAYVRQKPNSRWFSLLKLPLHVYSAAGTDTTKWLNRMLQSIGEPPVVFDSTKAVLTQGDLRQQLINEGFLKADVSMITSQHGRKTDVTYMLQPGQPYFIHHISYQIDDPCISRILQAEDTLRRLLHEGMRFDLNKLDAERKRITALLADSGYFRFNKEYITYRADTAAGSQLISLTLRLGLLTRNGRPDTLHSRYRVNSIEYANTDPTGRRLPLRQAVLNECTHLSEGNYYSATGLRNTYNHFGRMQAIRYTNISLAPEPDTTLLNCNIQLQAAKPSTISFQPEGTNTAGDLGAAASLTYQNRNLLRGSEVLSLQLRGAYEAIKGLEGYEGQDFTEYSLEARLQFPRLLVPFFSTHASSALTSTSELSLLYDLQDRPEFHRRVLSAAWRYKWHRPGSNQHFQLDVLDLNYVFMPWISSTFRREYLENETSRNAILRYNYEDLFITKFGVGYSYAKGPVAIKLNLETSGNLLSGASALFGARQDENGHYRLFNIAFAQYAKADIDVTRSWQIDEQNQIVAHIGFGIAYPYGNSSVLPFEKRYFSGGANSVRGWSVRSLGPGKYRERDGRINFISQTGDMKLDMNLEYRTHLFWKLGAAAFIDAGNVWTLRNYDMQPEGQFKPEELLSQLAVSYGMGMRLNLGYFILRFDLGMKAVNPAYKSDDDEHFPLLHPRFSRDYAFHFAVGLPF